MPRLIETALSGYELLNDPLLNKGTAFTDAERDAFNELASDRAGARKDRAAGQDIRGAIEEDSAIARHVEQAAVRATGERQHTVFDIHRAQLLKVTAESR